MRRSDVIEPHYITPTANLDSIMVHGIMSHVRATDLAHVSIANESVQQNRRNKRLPSGRMLHEYANLYFHARNPMMYFRKDSHLDLVVVRVSAQALDLPGVMIADGNAARTFGTAFWGPTDGLARLDRERVFAEYWTDSDPAEQDEKKRIKCAEVLVPDLVPPHLLRGVYVSCSESERRLHLTAEVLEVTIDEHMFFYRP
ncbi:MAG: DUF4433 domain-containing protein [Burkholderiales bacterium]